ncbi:MAG TPA: glycosyltransferase [Candidatus Acidoferrales bacterium]|nr:glycosyltransferase [Candidatus Acidoferrales bacterium]
MAKRTVFVYRSDVLSYSETFIKEQAGAYQEWHPILVGRKILDQLSLDGVEVHLLSENKEALSARVFAKLGRYFGYCPESKVLGRSNASLLHAHFGPDAVEAEALAQVLNIPLIVTFHGYDINIHREWWENGRGGPNMKRYPNRLLKLARAPNTHFIAVSEALRERAIAYGIPASKLKTFYIGIDAEKFRPGPIPYQARPARILFVGRLVEKKGCEYLVRAMPLVRSRVPEAHLHVIGEGPLRSRLEQLSCQLGIGARFLGSLSAEAVKAELDNARVLCLPSVHAANGDAEGFGLVLLEAQAAGVPVVTSAFGGAEEGIWQGITGFRFEEADISGMAARLIEILSDPRMSLRMGMMGRRFVAERFDIRQCTSRLEKFYNEVVREQPVN